MLGDGDIIDPVVIKITDGKTKSCAIRAGHINFATKAAVSIAKTHMGAEDIAAVIGRVSNVNLAVVIKITAIDLNRRGHSGCQVVLRETCSRAII